MEKQSPRKKQISAALVLGALLVLVGMAVSIGPALAAGEDDAIIEPKSIVTLPWKNAAQKPVPPSFVLPRQSRLGCLACHSNTKLSRIKDGEEQSLFVDPEVIGNSMHEKIACIDCHTNFTYEDHPAKNPKDYWKVAGLACMKCHPYQKLKYEKSIHGRLALEDKKAELNGKEVEPALCSSCHGSHNIQSPRFESYRSEFRLSSKKVCGQCHTDRYASYGDYYHGQAYKNKAKDAPTCWDCHDNHNILHGDDAKSPIASPANLRQACGKCHDDPGESLVTYAPLIHGRQEALNNNPIFRLLGLIIPERQPAEPEPETREPVVQTEILSETPEVGLFARIIGIFFPRSLRPLGG